MIKCLLWLLLAVVSLPLALLALILYPIIFGREFVGEEGKDGI
jgi:hypothetical protein